MKRIILTLLMVSMSAGFATNLHIISLERPPKNIDKSYPGPYPAVDLPASLRERNWAGGSCVHASMVMLFRIQRKFALANWWRKNHSGDEYPGSMAKQLDDAGIKYAFTSNKGDVKFLEWAIKTHRGCGVTVRGATHMIILIHLDKKWAGLIDNNTPEEIIWVPRKTFISEWLNSESWVITPIYKPGPPRPVAL